jgi:hypothetical protein
VRFRSGDLNQDGWEDVVIVRDGDWSQLLLKDLTGPARYERDGRELLSKGVFLDLPAWGCHVFELVAG